LSLLRCSEPAPSLTHPGKESRMRKVIYEKDDRIGRITLNRPEVMNAIDDDVPVELADCVARANADPGVHVIVLAGAGEAFCAGYDLTYYAQGTGGGVTQKMPWDPMKDYAFMMRNTELFMSLWRSYRPVICRCMATRSPAAPTSRCAPI
jgi:enoyl-CoA hydratase